jgi:hypothetical protein
LPRKSLITNELNILSRILGVFRFGKIAGDVKQLEETHLFHNGGYLAAFRLRSGNNPLALHELAVMYFGKEHHQRHRIY